MNPIRWAGLPVAFTRGRREFMRYPGAFSLYPVWLKPLLVSLGAMFVMTAIFLIILIMKSSPSAAATAAATAPAFTLQPVNPPSAAAPGTQPAPVTAPTAHATLTPVHAKAHKKMAHHAKHK